MRKFILGLLATLVVGTATVLVTAPAEAASSTTTKAPTTWADNVARGRTVRVGVDNHGSKVLARTSTLWQGRHRVNDWSPKPGAYKVRSVLTYQTKTTTKTRYWVPDEYCYGDYDEDGYWDDTLGCEDYGYWDWKTTTKLNPGKRRITRINTVRVAKDETPGCVSRSEFRAVKDGMSQAKVHGIFGTTGWVESAGSMGTTREYETCAGDEWSYAEVSFDPRVWFKWIYISY